MRTTLTLEDDAAEALQKFACGNRIPLGKAASELIRRGIRYELPIRMRKGLPYVAVPKGFPVITTEDVKRILEEEE